METVFTLALFSLLAFVIGMFCPEMVLCRSRKRACLLFASLFAVSVVIGLRALHISSGNVPPGTYPETGRIPGVRDIVLEEGTVAERQPVPERIRFHWVAVPGAGDTIVRDSVVPVFLSEGEEHRGGLGDFFSSKNSIKASLK